MNGVYGITVLVGAVGVLLAVGLSLNPERPPLARQIRLSILAVLGFGMAGISASFAGWPSVIAFVAAVIGAAGLAYLGIRYEPGHDGVDPE